MRAGDLVPFDGDLYPIDLSLRLGLGLEKCRVRGAIDLDHALERHEIRLRECRSIAEIRAEADQRRIGILESEFDRQHRWYRSTVFIVVVTAVTTVAALIGASYLLDVALGQRGR